MTKYNIGQELVLKEDLEVESMFGNKKTYKKGSKLYVTASTKPVMLARLDGDRQIIDDVELEGFSVNGIAEFLYIYLSRQFISLDDYEIEQSEFKEAIADALEELEMYDNTGNRS